MVDGDSWLIYPVLLLKQYGGKRVEYFKMLGLTVKEQKEVETVIRDLDELSLILAHQDLSASKIYELLQPLPVVGLLALLAANAGEALLRSRVLLYMEQLADVEIAIDGHDLLQLGFQSGPDMGRALKAVRRARLDGEVSSRDEELSLAGSMLTGNKGELK